MASGTRRVGQERLLLRSGRLVRAFGLLRAIGLAFDFEDDRPFDQPIHTGTLFFRRNRIGGVAVGDYTAASAQAAWQQIVKQLNSTGKRPVTNGVFAFTDTIKAFARLAEGPMGKVLVRVG